MGDDGIESALRRISTLRQFGVFPLKTRLHEDRWLCNFKEDEKALGVLMLSAFMYFPAPWTQKLFANALTSLSSYVCEGIDKEGSRIEAWNDFLKNAWVAPLGGDDGSTVVDSGFTFCRYARDFFGISEEQLVSVDKALDESLTARDKATIILVDDMIASGSQALATLDRTFTLPVAQTRTSLLQASAQGKVDVVLCVAVACSKGIEHIGKYSSRVTLLYGQLLDEGHNLLNPESPFWPKNKGSMYLQQLFEIDHRLGGRTLGTHGNLGLSIAFDHGAGKLPDNTLPIFGFRSSGWSPLIRSQI